MLHHQPLKQQVEAEHYQSGDSNMDRDYFRWLREVNAVRNKQIIMKFVSKH